jgi:hypothetical protein
MDSEQFNPIDTTFDETSLPSPATPAIHVPLLTLLTDTAACRSSRASSQSTKGLSSRGKEKMKSQESYRKKCFKLCMEEMDASGSRLKPYIRCHLEQAKTLVVNLEIPTCSGSWMGPQLQDCSGSSPSLHPWILSSPDAFRIAGLTPIRWDGRYALNLS